MTKRAIVVLGLICLASWSFRMFAGPDDADLGSVYKYAFIQDFALNSTENMGTGSGISIDTIVYSQKRWNFFGTLMVTESGNKGSHSNVFYSTFAGYGVIYKMVKGLYGKVAGGIQFNTLDATSDSVKRGLGIQTTFCKEFQLKPYLFLTFENLAQFYYIQALKKQTVRANQPILSFKATKSNFLAYENNVGVFLGYSLGLKILL